MVSEFIVFATQNQPQPIIPARWKRFDRLDVYNARDLMVYMLCTSHVEGKGVRAIGRRNRG